MRNLLLCMAVAGLAMVGCGGGPHCETVETCDPECDAAMGMFCNPESLACEEAMTCDPTCDTATQYCDIFSGNCVDLPADCDPECGTDEFCDDGTCEAIPVCDPDCAAGEVCVN